MATLVLARTFLPDYAKLEKPLRENVEEVIAKFQEGTHAGLHLEKHNNQADPRARTIRLNRQYRGIVVAPDTGDSYILTRVLNHDDAEAWMARNTFSVNEVTGALEVTDVVGVQGAKDELAAAPAPAEPSLFADVGEADLARLGVDPTVFPLLAKITSIEELDGLTTFLPDLQSYALHLLAEGVSVEAVWADIAAETAAAEEPIDTEDLAAAAARPVSQSMFHVVDDDTELNEIMQRPFELWRTFLHPSQRRWVDKEFNGPARITGGAGTGKTVVAMHRARWLAGRIDDTAGSDLTRRVLFTTYTTSLAEELSSTMGSFCKPDAMRHLDVMTVDKLANQIWSEANGRNPRPIGDVDVVDALRDAIAETGVEFSPEFLRQEWEQVVLGQQIRSRSDYFSAGRVGRGVRLSRRQRADVWKAIEAFTSRLDADGTVTFLQLADAAAEIAAARSVKPYAHVVVDEAQDLHPARWRLLRAVVDEAPDDLFIVGDTHQRIYDNRVSLSKLGIRITGRSHRLRINYRTTAEILRWSLALLTGESFDDMDEGTDTLAGYRSVLHGAAPDVVGFDDTDDENAALVDAVHQWLADGLEPNEIGVTVRAKKALESVKGALEDADIKVRSLTALKRDGVAVGTMHAMKGREFRAVAVAHASAGQIPNRYAVTSASADELQHQFDMQRERCLMYVACTRAREMLRVSWHGKPSEFLPGAM